MLRINLEQVNSIYLQKHVVITIMNHDNGDNINNNDNNYGNNKSNIQIIINLSDKKKTINYQVLNLQILATENSVY